MAKMSNTVVVPKGISDCIEFATKITGPANARWDSASEFVKGAMEIAGRKRNMIDGIWPIVDMFLTEVRKDKEILDDNDKDLLQFALKIEEEHEISAEPEYFGMWPKCVEADVINSIDRIRQLNREYFQRLEPGIKAYLSDFICETFAVIREAMIFEEALVRLLNMRSDNKDFYVYRRTNGNIVIVTR